MNCDEPKVYKVYTTRNEGAFGFCEGSDPADIELEHESVCLKSDVDNYIDQLKDEQLAATRHQKYKRCLAMEKSCKDCAEMLGCMAFHEKLKHGKTYHYQHCSLHANIKMCHRKKWLELAEKFKEAK